ncbi:serine/threonine protein kinase [Simiduia agarivorans]|uniref:Stress response kinase A n=1 Tax=Simiduia agarivorans (strain DSM 21679 / JCM 13881 / BCRC 17597 / SA1) TaxID=1117647 RepID=K4KJN0_SIMAS|nr:serine/threonine protein kinase [Simiduia agarivorans]AFU99181.1 serine/threonine protein kinase [Simiduia agarivorans SA1 = DSM 21679]
MSQPHPYAALTPDRVLDAIESTGRLTDARVFPLNSYENRVYQVGIEGGQPLIAKFYRPDRWTRDQILEEHRFTAELHAEGLSVVPPLTDTEGQSLWHFAGFDFALFARQGGYPPELDNLDHLHTLGCHLGQLHAIGKREPFQFRPSLDARSFGHDSAAFLLDGFIPSSLQEAYRTLSRDLLVKVDAAFARFTPKLLRLHGDCHPGNILWRDEVPHLVDFDDARMGPAIQDLWMLLSGDRQQQHQQLAEIIEGYEMFSEFDPRELSLVEPLRTLRMMHYAAWLARRWQDPAFPKAFSWFNTERYWAEHILELREQMSALDEPPLRLQ